jgi:hypothetical protein
VVSSIKANNPQKQTNLKSLFFRNTKVRKLLLTGLLLLPSLSIAGLCLVVEILPNHSYKDAFQELSRHYWIINGAHDHTSYAYNIDPRYTVSINGKGVRIEYIGRSMPKDDYHSLVDHLTKRLSLKHSRIKRVELPIDEKQYRQAVLNARRTFASINNGTLTFGDEDDKSFYSRPHPL